jgi:predicted SAM-dependent methyltransferase
MNVTPDLKRLNWGCGGWVPAGWINSDIREAPGINLPCNILEGLPLETGTIDYATSMHALQEVSFTSLVPVLQELRRVLKPRGVLRLGLPDLDKGIAAYQRGDAAYFQVPDDDARTVGAKFVTQMLWYGYSKVLFTSDFAGEILLKAGFADVRQCAFQETASAWPAIVELDNRQSETLFVEAFKA